MFWEIKSMEMKKKSDSSSRYGLLVILVAVTLVLVIAFSAFFIAFSVAKGDTHKNDRGNTSTREDKNSNQNDNSDKTTDRPSRPVSGNLLFPTIETRESYKITTSPSVVTLTDDFIKSNNTILVKVTDSSLTSIAEKGADQKMYPASMTKVMTLIVACENVKDLSKKLTVTEEMALYAEKQGGSGAGLRVGESYSVEDLLYLVAYQSDTIACLLLATDIAGNEAAFVDMMNAKVRAIGLSGTHFANCTGLFDEQNYSTCRDIASIMAYALDNSMAYKCLSSYTGRPMTVGGVDCIFYAGWYSQRFKDKPKLKTVTVKAGKTGYIDESGVSLVSYAESADGARYINVIVGRPKGSGLSETLSTEEVKKIYNTYAK